MFPPDLIEERIASMAQAEALLHDQATATDNSLRLWYQWYEPRVGDKHVRKLTKKLSLLLMLEWHYEMAL